MATVSMTKDKSLVEIMPGVWYLPAFSNDRLYNQDYFNRYVSYEGSQISKALNDFRASLIDPSDRVLDFGCGALTLLRRLPNKIKYGTDVIPLAIAALNKQGWFWQGQQVDTACFFDSLEHLPDPIDTLRTINAKNIVVSIPVWPHKTDSGIEYWHHYRPNEHLWYFNREGFISWIKKLGYSVLHESTTESELGRLHIRTFVCLKDNSQLLGLS